MHDQAGRGDHGIGALHHVGIVAPHLERATGQIAAVLGGETIDRGSDDELGVEWAWVESSENPIFEILTPLDKVGPVARYLDRHGPGLHHVSFQPDSLDRAIAHAQHRCLAVIGEDRAASGYEQFFIDPEMTSGALFHSFRALP